MLKNAAQNRARAARRSKSRRSIVESWWSSLPDPKPNYVTPLALSTALHLTHRPIAGALRELGWRRIFRRVHGKKTTLWLPPHSSVKPRPIGRPRNS